MKRPCLMALSVIGIVAHIAVAQVPALISYQGRLLENQILLNEDLPMIFKLYPAETNGTADYEEQMTVAVREGLYSVHLGENPLSGSLQTALAGGTAYLEVTVNGTVLSPRERITSVAYAFVADRVSDGGVTIPALDASIDARYVNVAGDSLSGDLVMGGNRVTSLGTPFSATDAATKDYVDAITGNLTVDSLTRDFPVAAGDSVTAGEVVDCVAGYVVDRGNAASPSLTLTSTSSFSGSYVLIHNAVASLAPTTFVALYETAETAGNMDRNGRVSIGTVAGTTITWGTEAIFNPGDIYDITTAPLDSTRFVVAFSDTNGSTVRVGSVSGDIVSWGADVVFSSSPFYTSSLSLVSLGPNTFVLTLVETDSSDQNFISVGKARVGTVSGLDLTLGVPAVFDSDSIGRTSCASAGANQVVVTYADFTGGSRGVAKVGTVSGATIAWGQESVFNPAQASPSAASLGTDKVVVVYEDGDNSGYSTARVGTIAASVISWGAEYVFRTDPPWSHAVSALGPDKFVVVREKGNVPVGYGTARVGSVVGDTITWSNEGIYNSDHPRGPTVAGLDQNTFVVINSTDSGPVNGGSSAIGIDTSSSIAVPIGIARESRSSGEMCPIAFAGAVRGVYTNLAIGRRYYEDGSGSLTETDTGRYVGLSIGSDELLIQTNWVW